MGGGQVLHLDTVTYTTKLAIVPALINFSLLVGKDSQNNKCTHLISELQYLKLTWPSAYYLVNILCAPYQPFRNCKCFAKLSQKLYSCAGLTF